jgi:hypothetical protein
MKTVLALTVFALALCVPSRPALADPVLHNGDLSAGLSGWHGDGELTYLMPDGTEAGDASTGGVPVLKLHLTGEPHAVYQEYDTRQMPAKQDITVEAMPSLDFKRSTDPSLYSIGWTSGTWYWSDVVLPKADFWIRGIGTDFMWYYRLASLTQGKWTKVEGKFQDLSPSETHTVNFCVPSGEGSVYLRNAVVAP